MEFHIVNIHQSIVVIIPLDAEITPSRANRLCSLTCDSTDTQNVLSDVFMYIVTYVSPHAFVNRCTYTGALPGSVTARTHYQTRVKAVRASGKGCHKESIFFLPMCASPLENFSLKCIQE